jgi:hypothetical protein
VQIEDIVSQARELRAMTAVVDLSAAAAAGGLQPLQQFVSSKASLCALAQTSQLAEQKAQAIYEAAAQGLVSRGFNTFLRNGAMPPAAAPSHAPRRPDRG